MARPIHVYETDFGPVRISEDEARLMQLGVDAQRFGARLPLELDAKIARKRGDIEAVARYRFEGVGG